VQKNPILTPTNTTTGETRHQEETVNKTEKEINPNNLLKMIIHARAESGRACGIKEREGGEEGGWEWGEERRRERGT